MYGFSKIYFLFATETNQEKEVSNGGGGVKYYSDKIHSPDCSYMYIYEVYSNGKGKIIYMCVKINLKQNKSVYTLFSKWVFCERGWESGPGFFPRKNASVTWLCRKWRRSQLMRQVECCIVYVRGIAVWWILSSLLLVKIWKISQDVGWRSEICSFSVLHGLIITREKVSTGLKGT